jgi:hypothetical protein
MCKQNIQNETKKKKQMCHVQMEQMKVLKKKGTSYANRANYDNKSILKR